MMNMNKMMSAGVAGLFCAVTLAGCGGAASSSEAVSSEVASSAASSAASSVAASSAASSAAASSVATTAAPTATAEPTTGNVLYLTGTVSNAMMNSFTLTLDDGSTTEIMIADDCEKELADGLSEGMEIAVGGTTEDGGATMTAVYLGNVSDGAGNDMLYGAVEFLTGTVSDAMMNGFTLKMADGTDVQVTTLDETQMNLADGLSDGLTVGVAGVLGEQGAFNALSVTDDEYAVSEYTHEMKAYVGTLQNCMMNSFSLTLADGTSVDFVKSDACVMQMENGMSDGAEAYVQAYEADGTLTALDVAGIE